MDQPLTFKHKIWINQNGEYKSILKFIIAALSGILCFFLSQYNISYQYSGIDINIPWSLMLPVAISLAYGRKAAIVAGVAGGALYPFLLWPQNGWANVSSVIYLLIFYVLIGYFSEYRKRERQKVSTVAIGFMLSVGALVMLVTTYILIYPILLSFNPPFWIDDADTYFPRTVLSQIFVKEIINLALILLFCEALLRMPLFRKFLGLEINEWMKANDKAFIISIAAAFIVWGMFFILDYFLHVLPAVGERDYLTLSFMVIILSGGILGRGMMYLSEKNRKARQDLIVAMEKAEENEKQFKKAQKKAMIGNWVWHIKEDRIWWSDEMYRIFEVDKETFTGDLGKVIDNVIHPDDREKVHRSNVSVVKDNKPFPVEYRIILKDGSIRHVYAQADQLSLDENGKSVRLDGIVKDITDHRNALDQLVQAKEKAEENDRLKSAFLANMSHEIRTPMNGIIGFAELLSDPELTLETRQEYLDIIKASGSRLLELINDMVDISKIEAGQIKVVATEFKIKPVIEEQFLFFKPEAEKKGLNFYLESDEDLNNLVLKTDKLKLTAVLINLIKNAIKYTREGSVTLGYLLHPNNELEFYVKDTGIGVPRDMHESIFNRFERIHSVSSANIEGVGLGLSISKAYVQLLGGRIWVESNDKGSVFRFTIPLTEGKISVPEQKKKSSSPVALSKDFKASFLVVDDDPNARLMLKLFLKDLTENYYFAKDGREAIRFFEEKKPVDLVLMDIKMPVMDGYETTMRIRELDDQVPIIAQTAYAFSEDVRKVKEAGCTDYITKPVNKENLINLIIKHLSKQPIN